MHLFSYRKEIKIIRKAMFVENSFLSETTIMKDISGNNIAQYNGEIDLYNIVRNANHDFFEDAVHVCDLSDIIKKYSTWLTHMPRVTPFYAVKCNNNPTILKLLATLGTGFDCASKGEISTVVDLGVTPDKIIFANPTKPASHLMYAFENGVTTMTFDNDFELFKVKKYYPQANLVLRIKCEAEKAFCPLGNKYGCDPVTDAPRLILLAKNLDLQVVGICFHVGSGCEDFPVYERAIAKSKTLFDYARTIGYNFELLDIGGGFPGDKGTSIEEAATIVSRALEKYFPEEDGVKIIAEPGRFFVSSAYTLVCKIHSKREIVEDENIRKIMYYINDGVYGSFNCILVNQPLTSPKCIYSGKKSIHKSTIWGPTCDAFDIIYDNILLPDLDIGDFLVFENMGAYTLAIASGFNGFSVPSVKFFIDAKDEQLIAVNTTTDFSAGSYYCNNVALNSDGINFPRRRSSLSNYKQSVSFKVAANCEHSFFNTIIELLWNLLLCL